MIALLPDCLSIEGLVDPVVIPRLTDYDVCVANGVRCLRQRHGKPEPMIDARSTNSSGLDLRI